MDKAEPISEPRETSQTPRPRRRGQRYKGEGTISHRSDGRWQVRVFEHGKRTTIYRATEAEARKALKEAQSALEDRRPVAPPSLKVEQFLNSWLQQAEIAGSIRATTLRNYRSYVKLHLIPGLGWRQVVDLSVTDVQGFMAKSMKAGKSARLVNYCRVVLRAALNEARRQRLVRDNVAELTRPAKITDKIEIVPLTPEQAKVFLSSVAGDRLEALYLVTLALGLREGEALGLCEEDLDLGRGRIHIRRELTRIDGEYRLEPVKTDKSRRTLALPETAKAALATHLDKRPLEQEAAGAKWIGNPWGLVFTTDQGAPIHATVVSKAFQRHLAKAGLPKKRFYDLRHSAASFMKLQGAELFEISRQLGHSTIKLTGDTYTHIFEEQQRRLANNMDEFLRTVSRGHSSALRYEPEASPSD
ncbi:MAG: tyrosine-type recombinase/integrase [Chloroflexota bacterium]